jgi:ferredoxin
VAELLEAALLRREAQVDLIKIEDVLHNRVSLRLDGHDLIGILHPIYGFGTPQIVFDFCDLLPPREGERVFLLKSAGDYVQINNGASKPIVRRLARKGYQVFYDRIICMASNWLVGYDDRLAKQLYAAAAAKTEHVADEVLSGQWRELRVAPVLGLIAWLVHEGERRGARWFGRSLHVSDACTECKLCVRECPTGNVRYDGDQVVFGNACVWCMRCIYACPQGAISSRGFGFCILGDGYDIRTVVDDPDSAGDYVTADTRGYFRHFYRYLQDDTL